MARLPQRFVVVDLGTLRPPGVPQVQGIDTPAVGAVRLNERDQIVGNSDGEVGGRRGFLWDPGTGLRALSLPPARQVGRLRLPPGREADSGVSDVGSGVSDINDFGHALGWVRADTPWHRACLWRGRSRLLLDTHMPPDPHRETEAFAINDQGEIAGGGVVRGERRALLLEPV